MQEYRIVTCGPIISEEKFLLRNALKKFVVKIMEYDYIYGRCENLALISSVNIQKKSEKNKINGNKSPSQ